MIKAPTTWLLHLGPINIIHSTCNFSCLIIALSKGKERRSKEERLLCLQEYLQIVVLVTPNFHLPHIMNVAHWQQTFERKKSQVAYGNMFSLLPPMKLDPSPAHYNTSCWAHPTAQFSGSGGSGSVSIVHRQPRPWPLDRWLNIHDHWKITPNTQSQFYQMVLIILVSAIIHGGAPQDEQFNLKRIFPLTLKAPPGHKILMCPSTSKPSYINQFMNKTKGQPIHEIRVCQGRKEDPFIKFLLYAPSLVGWVGHTHNKVFNYKQVN